MTTKQRLSTVIPQHVTVAPTHPGRRGCPSLVGSRSALQSRLSTRLPAGLTFLRGFHHWFLHTHTSPSCLPGQSCLVVSARPGVVEAAPALPLVSEVTLSPASEACCDRPPGTLPPPGHVAPRGTPSSSAGLGWVTGTSATSERRSSVVVSAKLPSACTRRVGDDTAPTGLHLHANGAGNFRFESSPSGFGPDLPMGRPACHTHATPHA